ncbi:MAG: DNA polymerase III subunit gamma/tau [Bdellovibrionaceae bacterium]|nr:DNA polymerase III subunit gamma/tau [Pseudobdellovibrionaceae bacterium]
MNLPYQVIARKWRPQFFGQLIGQDHISQTLLNALKKDSLHHALLFTGPRGTGKTSSARIVAKSLRCPHVKDGTPCGTCDSCQEIAEGRSMDVIELDAASNNSVDDIKRLLEGVRTSPSSGRYKVYIVDEVHMLSSAAFNSLLKTLEEPPHHVKFILATTEVHKIPETILSRCLRFDFRRIPTRQISEHLRSICEKEGFNADEDALWLIARQGDGSMRDAQSLLDQCLAFADGQLTKRAVVDILGLTDRALLFSALESMVHRDREKAVHVASQLLASGTEPKLFAQELLEMVRHLLMVKVAGAEVTDVLDLPDSELRELAQLSTFLGEEDIHLLFDLILKGVTDISRAYEPRLVLEMLLLRAACAPRIVELASLLAGQPTPSKSNPPPPAKKPDARPVTSTTAPVKKKFLTAATPKEKWLRFVEKIKEENSRFGALLEAVVFAGEEGRLLKLAVPPKGFLKDGLETAESKRLLQEYIDSYWGAGFNFNLIATKNAVGETAEAMARREKELKEEALRKELEQHPMVRAVRSEFGEGSMHVTSIKGSEK